MPDLRKIEELVKAERLARPSASTKDLVRHLRNWWCMKYGRPFKDPLLDAYTLEELFYEFMTYFYMNPDNDPLKRMAEDQKLSEDETWAAEQLAAMQESADQNASPPELGENKESLPTDLPEFNTKFEE